MAESAKQQVRHGIELLVDALLVFISDRISDGGNKTIEMGNLGAEVLNNDDNAPNRSRYERETIFDAMNESWEGGVQSILSDTERPLVVELAGVRRKLTRNEIFSYDDAERALDSMRRLAEAIDAGGVADEIGRMRNGILRTKFAELSRNVARRKKPEDGGHLGTVAGLRPWREVVLPHDDVATGKFMQAEFAADLGTVLRGEATSEYGDPIEFYDRTFFTSGLTSLITSIAKRISGTGGDPVVDLRTNFGGGKTHSMLALYHMTGGVQVADIPRLDHLFEREGLTMPGKVNRAVLVGTGRGPSDASEESKSRQIYTSWGEIAWQLGGEEAFAMVAEQEASGISPGSGVLKALLRSCAPCLILIDEWVAYLRQIYRRHDLPSGSFDSNLSFVQSLTEAVKATPHSALVASLPASQIEVGGEGGQEALDRLRLTFGRVDAPWQAASHDEGFEIVRQRLFQDIPSERCRYRDNAVQQFSKMYRDNSSVFHQSCMEKEYRNRMTRAYPIHPELFSQLYLTWGTLEEFQLTRGVLRFLAQVIHELWMADDHSYMIMPANISASSERIRPELFRYLDEQWMAVIDGDVDGDESTPHEIDLGNPTLGRISATRKIARAIFLGTAPTYREENRGLDDKQILLGVVQPGENPAIFGDALRKLANGATFMHSNGSRYWYSITASLNRRVRDIASELDEKLVATLIDRELVSYINAVRDESLFNAVQINPTTSTDIPDENGPLRIVVLGVNQMHSNRDTSVAKDIAKDYTLQRGGEPRVYRNTLLFLACDKRQYEYVESSARATLAWREVVRDKGRFNLSFVDSERANEKVEESERELNMRIRDAWCYLIYPIQTSAHDDMEWEATRLNAQDGIFTSARRKLEANERLFPVIGPVRLQQYLHSYVWSEQNHLRLQDIWDYLNRYPYLPRMANKSVLVKCVRTAISDLVPGPFAYAEKWDMEYGYYRGLVVSHAVDPVVIIDSESVIVQSSVAAGQHSTREGEHTTDEDGQARGVRNGGKGDGGNGDRDGTSVTEGSDSEGTGTGTTVVSDPSPAGTDVTRFFGATVIPNERPILEFGRIVEEIVSKLDGGGANVVLTLEIDVENNNTFSEDQVQDVLENANTLRFIDKKFS